MKWAIYERKSLADVHSIETMLDRLRASAQVLGDEKPVELHDAAERQQFQRPGRRELDRLIQGGEVSTVVLSDLHRPFTGLRDMAYTMRRWLDAGVRLVVLARELDTDHPAQKVLLEEHLGFMLAFETMAARERGVLSALRHRTSPQLPKVADVEIAALMRKGFSHNGIIDQLRRSERRIGKGTVGKAVARVIARGEVSRVTYEAAKARRSARRNLWELARTKKEVAR